MQKKKVREKSRECNNHKPQPFTKGDCKVQTLALEIITPLNECTGRLSRQPLSGRFLCFNMRTAKTQIRMRMRAVFVKTFIVH